MNSADASWNGPARNLPNEITLTNGGLKLSPYSFMVMEQVMEQAQAGAEAI